MNPALEIKTLIIGGGVVGLAVARALALRDGFDATREMICLVEREAALGQHASSRNSEVIHAGIYYPLGSLKAQLCVRGRRMLYRYAEARGVPYRRIEKLIVARPDQDLSPLYQRGLENGVEGLSLLSVRETRRLEPEITPCESLRSAQTGIIDSHQYLRALTRDFKDAGGEVLLQTPVCGLERARGDRYLVRLGGKEPQAVVCEEVINCTGLWAPWLTAWLPPSEVRIQPSYALGRYFALRRPPAVKRLIYPTPEVGGLGVHLTWDLGGRAKLGPDVQWVDGPAELTSQVDYGWDDPDEALQRSFYERARGYLPTLQYDDLIPDQAGMRAKSAPRGAPSDFLILGGAQRQMPGLIHLIGIESPGLTASLAIAETVVERLSN